MCCHLYLSTMMLIDTINIPNNNKFSIMPAFMLLSFGVAHLSSSKCTPSEGPNYDEACSRAANMLCYSRNLTFTVAFAMERAGYCKEDCQFGMLRKRVECAPKNFDKLNWKKHDESNRKTVERAQKKLE